MRPLSLLITLLTAAADPLAAQLPAPTGENVLLVVWDGMRPDFISPENTPTLHALAQRGTFFTRNHSTYITSTEVNGTVLATGVFGERTTIVANREYRPDVNLVAPVPTEDPHAIRIGDAISGGKWITVPTVAELVQQAGFRTAVSGTKHVALVHDRSHDREAKHGSAIVFAGAAYPLALEKNLTAALGKWPSTPRQPDTGSTADPVPNTAQNRWTTRALTEHLWRDGTPRYSVLWLGDPDYSQHYTYPGTRTALAAIRASDDHLALALAALEKNGALEKTNVFIVSDHGFSTIDRGVDLGAYFKKRGLSLQRDFRKTPQDGEIMAVSVGGTVGFYVIGKKAGIIQQIVDALHESEFAGPVFTRKAMPGTFALADARMGSPEAPDVVFSFRWHEGKNDLGIPGCIFAETKMPPLGTHATTSRYDIHNTLVAAGPDIRPGYRDQEPTGNIDVAPTILHLLGIAAPHPLDGRILAEALRGGETTEPSKAETRRIETTRKIGTHEYRAYLQFTERDGKRYLDEGNASTRN